MRGAAHTRTVHCVCSGNEILQAAGGRDGKGTRHSRAPVGIKDGNRLTHVLRHMVDNPKKADHGIFKVTNVFDTMDEAWAKVKSIDPKKWNQKLEAGQSETVDGITRELRLSKNGRIEESFTIPMNRTVGVTGGKNGDGSALGNIFISVFQGTETVITAFPK